MNLNLGCGRMIFPTSPDNPFINHIKYQLIPYCPEALDASAQWCNIDQTAVPGVNETIDLFAYPWVRSSNGSPFNDSSIDAIWASHIVEHIPHEGKLTIAAGLYPAVKKAALNNGWWGFFAECWRVLKPGGIIHILSPMGFSTAGVADPTHRRYLTPASFSYFAPNPNAPFDYRDAMHFEATGEATVRLVGEAAELNEAIGAADKLLAQMDAASDDYKELSSNRSEMITVLQGWMDSRINAADEFFLSMRAIKDPI